MTIDLFKTNGSSPPTTGHHPLYPSVRCFESDSLVADQEAKQ